MPMFGLALKNDSNYYLLTLRASHRPTASTSPRDRLDVSLLQQHVVSTLCPTQQTHRKQYGIRRMTTKPGLGTAGHRYGCPSCSIRPKWLKSKPSPGGRADAAQVDLFLPKTAHGLVMNVMEGNCSLRPSAL